MLGQKNTLFSLLLFGKVPVQFPLFVQVTMLTFL